MTDKEEKTLKLGEIGLQGFAPYLMNRIMGRYNASLQVELVKSGLTTPKMRTLAVLAVKDGILIRELAVYAVVVQSTLSRSLDKLELDNLIRRETDAEDSRATRIFITEKGRTTFEQIWPKMAESYENMFRNISLDDRNAFVATLQKILNNVRQNEF